MSDHRQMKGKIALVKLSILSVWFPVIVYLLACAAMGTHYERLSEQFGNTGLDMSERQMDDAIYRHIYASRQSQCEAARYMSADIEAVSHMGFNALDMIRNWNTDFLAEQPACPIEDRHD